MTQLYEDIAKGWFLVVLGAGAVLAVFLLWQLLILLRQRRGGSSIAARLRRIRDGSLQPFELFGGLAQAGVGWKHLLAYTGLLAIVLAGAIFASVQVALRQDRAADILSDAGIALVTGPLGTVLLMPSDLESDARSCVGGEPADFQCFLIIKAEPASEPGKGEGKEQSEATQQSEDTAQPAPDTTGQVKATGEKQE